MSQFSCCSDVSAVTLSDGSHRRPQVPADLCALLSHRVFVALTPGKRKACRKGGRPAKCSVCPGAARAHRAKAPAASAAQSASQWGWWQARGAAFSPSLMRKVFLTPSHPLPVPFPSPFVFLLPNRNEMKEEMENIVPLLMRKLCLCLCVSLCVHGFQCNTHFHKE